MCRTKIVATLGPATDDPVMLASVVAAGVDVVRLNASHSTRDELASRLTAVRAAAATAGREVGVLLDLPGPKVRVGEVASGTRLETGTVFTLAASPVVGDARRASVSYAGLAGDVAPGARILIDDGRIELLVESVSESETHARVVAGGPLASRKGVNIPGVTLTVGAVTPRDRELVAWAVESGVDWLAQSFVRSAHDIDELRGLMGSAALPIVAKIEKHEAVGRIEEIVSAADGVMVARGDLGVETSPERVPVVQRRIVSAARSAGKPVIIATEMLDSMRERPRPTRAEASDVANAIFGRADAVMLSGETAVGAFPLESVQTMVRIIDAAEAAISQPRAPKATSGRDNVQAAVSAAASELAGELGLAAIVTLTQSGATALAVSRYRPLTPIVAVAPHAGVARRLALVWGVRTLVRPLAEETGALLDEGAAAVLDAGLAHAGERIAITAGLGSNIPGGTDFVHVRVL